MNKLTTDRLEKFVNDIKTDGMCDITDSQVESVLIRLLAYEQAAEKPYGYLEPCDFPRTTATVYPEKDKYAFMPLYAAPVLPKQPELVENLKKVMNSWLAMEPKLAYQPEFTDVMMLLDAEAAPAQPAMPVQEVVGWIFEDELPKNYPYDAMFVHSKVDVVRMFPVFAPSSAQPVIPERLLQAINRLLDNDGSRGCFDALEQHRAKTELERLLASTAQPVIPEGPHRICDDDLVAVPRSVLACAGYAYGKAGLKDGNAYAQLRTYFFAPAITAQPVIPERPELRYGDNVLWFLNELAAFDASDIDSDDFDVYGEDRNGMEGCATISITELAADAAKLLSAQPVSEPYKLNGWISVDEKMPEATRKDQYFITYRRPNKNFKSVTGGFSIDLFRKGCFAFSGVTHWMPLPAAPDQDDKSASTELPNHSELSTNSPVIPDGSAGTNCIWSTDSDGIWLGDCGVTWQFFDDGPNENGLKYCPSCGKKVSVIAAPAQEHK